VHRRPAFALVLALGIPALGFATAAPTRAGTPAHLNWAASAAEIDADCKRAIDRAGVRADAVAGMPVGRRGFATVVAPLEDLSADLNDDLAAQTFLSAVGRQRGVRDAALACENRANDFVAALSGRADLARAVADAEASGTARSTADRKLLALWGTAFRRAGALLPPDRHDEFVRLEQQLGALQTQFGANLANDRVTLLFSARELAGLPPDFTQSLARRGDDYVVPVDESTARFLSQASDAGARKAYYLAYGNLGATKNLPLLRTALEVRDRLAHLLGYPNWAAYVLADRMAATPQRVDDFLDELDRGLMPRARAEIARLAALKARDLRVRATTLNPWDVSYYDARLRRTTYAVDEDAVKRYFPVDHVVPAVLGIYARLLGVNFKARVAPALWAPDVAEYAVHDAATGKYLGDFFLDLYPRDGKYTHFASFPILPARRRADGTMRPAEDAIVGNWPRPAPGKPALLTHGEVETFFHEFGHDMATMLATAPYETLSAGFRADFVEAPSQMLENWVWDPAILHELGANVETGAPLPDALVKRIVAARYVDDAYFSIRQVMLASIDMRYHESGGRVDTTAVWAEAARTLTPMPIAPGIHPEASFGHLMGGYDAGYYGYLWSKVYAQDLFTAFQARGLENPVVGMRYRDEILAPARTLEPDVAVRAFLGRPMSTAAFYRDLGIAAPPETTRETSATSR